VVGSVHLQRIYEGWQRYVRVNAKLPVVETDRDNHLLRNYLVPSSSNDLTAAGESPAAEGRLDLRV
jgi:hypothetical protein